MWETGLVVLSLVCLAVARCEVCHAAVPRRKVACRLAPLECVNLDELYE